MRSQAYKLLVLDDSFLMQTVRNAFYFVCGMCALLLLWSWVSHATLNEIPGVTKTWAVFKTLYADAFYFNPENAADEGIGWKLWDSIQRVLLGFTLGSIVAVPLGMIMGSNKMLMNILNPVVQILRPVSPLVWFILGQIALKSSPGALIFMIFITSLWPTLINTSFGVASIPDDHKNVGKAFGFSTWKYVTKIAIPFAMPHIITGLRLSIGIAWMVIFAGEMLSGDSGIGSFAWESYNGGNYENILSALLIIGLVGVLLDKGFSALQQSFAYDKK
ncbi:MAG: ABC transporter permease [Opitutaceae bacterium]|nr:ABC transporter permease [Cytophagales bacterium]